MWPCSENRAGFGRTTWAHLQVDDSIGKITAHTPRTSGKAKGELAALLQQHSIVCPNERFPLQGLPSVMLLTAARGIEPKHAHSTKLAPKHADFAEGEAPEGASEGGKAKRSKAGKAKGKGEWAGLSRTQVAASLAGSFCRQPRNAACCVRQLCFQNSSPVSPRG